MPRAMTATYTGPNGTFTAYKSVSSGTGWVTGPDGYIGGYTSYSDAIDFAIYFANRTDNRQSFNEYYNGSN